MKPVGESLPSRPKPCTSLENTPEILHVRCKGKSLERAGSVTGEVVLCSGLVDAGGAQIINRRRYMEPRFIIVS